MEFNLDRNKIYHSNMCGYFRILREIEDSEPMAEIQFLLTGNKQVCNIKSILNHQVIDNFNPFICGIGFLGNASRENNEKIYSVWVSMLNTYIKNKHKLMLLLDNNWLCFENFLHDIYDIEGYQDMIANKDKTYNIYRKIYNNNGTYNIYSIDTCILLNTQELKNDLYKKQKINNKFYGVTEFHKGSYTVNVLDRYTNKNKIFGSFNDIVVAAAVADVVNYTHGNPITMNNVGIQVTQELINKHKESKHDILNMILYSDKYIPITERSTKNITARNIAIGDRIDTNNYGQFEVIAMLEPRRTYKEDGTVSNTEKMCRIKFINTGTEMDVMVRNAVKGNVRDCYAPAICGVACLGNTTSIISNTRTHNPLFNHWNSMIHRCYDPNNAKYNSYGGSGVRVCDRWLCFENFEIDAQYIKGYQDMINNSNTPYVLDKDILQQGIPTHMKIYSLETCIWLPAYDNAIQSIIDNKHKYKNKYYCVHEDRDKYRVRVRNIYTGDAIDGGLFTNEIAAVNVANYYIRMYGDMRLYNYEAPYMDINVCFKYKCYKSNIEINEMIKIIK